MKDFGLPALVVLAWMLVLPPAGAGQEAKATPKAAAL